MTEQRAGNDPWWLESVRTALASIPDAQVGAVLNVDDFGLWHGSVSVPAEHAVAASVALQEAGHAYCCPDVDEYDGELRWGADVWPTDEQSQRIASVEPELVR